MTMQLPMDCRKPVPGWETRYGACRSGGLYRKQIDGKCADLNNVAQGTFAGSIIGALYLAEFVSASTAWAHLDIMAANPAAKPGRPEGGEATALRALYAYIRQRYA